MNAPPTKTAARKRAAMKGRTPSAAAENAATRTVPPRRAAPEALVVRADERPWTAAELAEVRALLETEAARLRSEISEAESDIADLLRESTDTGGEDQADTGTKTFEREHEMSLAASHREILGQTERALSRIDDGSYGVCESCGNPIGKARLQAFPRATLCMTCKQREERR
jgi:DnaK suppressor protein